METEDYTKHLNLLRSTYPEGKFSLLIRVEMPESEPGMDDAVAGNMDPAGVDPFTVVNYVEQAKATQQERVRAQRAELIRQAEEHASAVERIHAPIIHLPGSASQPPDAHLIQTMAMDRERLVRPPLAWG